MEHDFDIDTKLLFQCSYTFVPVCAAIEQKEVNKKFPNLSLLNLKQLFSLVMWIFCMFI